MFAECLAREKYAKYRRPLAFCFALTLILSACGESGPAAHCDHNLPEEGKWMVPLYPDAQQVQNTKSPTYWQLTTTFQTTATPAQIASFYQDALMKAGWQPHGLLTELRF